MKDYEQLYYDIKFKNKKLKEENEILKKIIEDYKLVSNNSKILLAILEMCNRGTND